MPETKQATPEEIEGRLWAIEMLLVNVLRGLPGRAAFFANTVDGIDVVEQHSLAAAPNDDERRRLVAVFSAARASLDLIDAQTRPVG